VDAGAECALQGLGEVDTEEAAREEVACVDTYLRRIMNTDTTETGRVYKGSVEARVAKAKKATQFVCGT